jgi:hypothetical protein
MKKFVLGIMVVAVVVVSLGVITVAYAQTVTSHNPNPGTGNGYGRMGGRSGQGGMMGSRAQGTQTGLLHDEMVAIYAQKLGISADELNQRLTNSETMAQIAIAQGKSLTEFQALMTVVRTLAIDQAIKDGKLTQEQADWMKQWGGGTMAGSGMGGRGMHGLGQGTGNPDCPFYTVPANP